MPPGTIFVYLDRNQGAASAILSAVLVLVTIYYAWQNRKMATEMKRTREAADLPILGLDFLRIGPTTTALTIRNVGPGTAFSIDVEVIWERPGVAQTDVRQPWRGPILASGESRELFPPGELGNNINILPGKFASIRLAGSVKDSGGSVHAVDHTIADLAAWREALHESRERWVDSPERRLAKAFGDHFEKHSKLLSDQLREISQAVSRGRDDEGDRWQGSGWDREYSTHQADPHENRAARAAGASAGGWVRRALRRSGR